MKNISTWKKSFFASPGPKSFSSFLKLFIKGIAMGSADIIPGVSGGTIAFITGIYEQLINAIKSFDMQFVKFILKLEIKKALSHIHLRFLLTLVSGIALAVISIAKLMEYLLNNYSEETWSLFFGLILASIVLIIPKVKNISGGGGLGILFGAIVAYFVVALIPAHTANNYFFIFVSGIIAISAMVLPGISGAFILVLLGKYEFMIHALKNPFYFKNQIIIIVFLLGCFFGIISFVRIVSYLLKKYHNLSIAVLLGFVIGSLRKIWPWKEIVKSEIINNKLHTVIEKNIFPNFNEKLFLEIFIIIFSFSFVLFLNKKAQKNRKTKDA